MVADTLPLNIHLCRRGGRPRQRGSNAAQLLSPRSGARPLLADFCHQRQVSFEFTAVFSLPSATRPLSHLIKGSIITRASLPCGVQTFFFFVRAYARVGGSLPSGGAVAHDHTESCHGHAVTSSSLTHSPLRITRPTASKVVPYPRHHQVHSTSHHITSNHVAKTTGGPKQKKEGKEGEVWTGWAGTVRDSSSGPPGGGRAGGGGTTSHRGVQRHNKTAVATYDGDSFPCPARVHATAQRHEQTLSTPYRTENRHWTQRRTRNVATPPVDRI